MKPYIDLLFFLRRQALVPAIDGSPSLIALKRYLLVSGDRFCLMIYSGLFNLNIFNQTPSNKAQIKYPVIIQENIAENSPLSKDIKGSTNKHPTNRNNLTFGICLANSKSCSDDMFQSSGTELGSGRSFHSLFLKVYSAISNRLPTIGYNTKQNAQKLLLLKKSPNKKEKIPVTIPFGIIAKNPEEAIILGLESTLFNIIYVLSIKIICNIPIQRIAQISSDLNHFIQEKT